MWTQAYSKVYQGIKKETVWKLWADVNHYTKWHAGLDYCKLESDFSVGNHFMLKPKGAPAVKVVITELLENKRFVDCTSFLGAKMYDIHEIEELNDGVKISNTIQVIGLLSFVSRTYRFNLY